MDKHTKLMLIMLAFKVSRPNCICMLHVIPELANISGLGNELANINGLGNSRLTVNKELK